MGNKRRTDRVPFTRELLERHLGEGLAPKEIGALYGYTAEWVNAHLRRFGLKKASNIHKDFPVDQQWLEQKHVAEGLTIRQIGDLLGWADSAVYRRLLAFGIVRTLKRRPSRDWLFEHYWTLNWSTQRISKECEADPATASKWLRHYGIPLKPHRLHFDHIPKRLGNFTHSQRRAILARDGDCRLCGATDNLECHHIMPTRYGGRNMIENGITLCVPCHDPLRDHELEWIERLLPLRGHL